MNYEKSRHNRMEMEDTKIVLSKEDKKRKLTRDEIIHCELLLEGHAWIENGDWDERLFLIYLFQNKDEIDWPRERSVSSDPVAPTHDHVAWTEWHQNHR